MNDNEFAKFQTAIEEKKPRWPFWAMAALFFCGGFVKSRWEDTKRHRYLVTQVTVS
jgi:hypothetical protein